MDGETITDVTSDAYSLINELFVEGGLYTDGEYLAVAMSSFYGSVGDKFRITLSSGQIIKVIMVDVKNDKHVDDNYSHKTDGSVVEFIVDTETLDEQILLTGSLDCIFKGSIKKIEIMEE